MGTLKRFNLGRIIKKYNIEFLFETGTWQGDSVEYAKNAGFKKIYSSEIVKEISDKAKERFKNDQHVEIINGSSSEALRDSIDKMDGNCLFWLDAHFPGAEEGLKGYNETEDDAIKFPLDKELEIIALRKAKYQDVILIDDLRIYEDGPYKNGNMPENIIRPKKRNINFVGNSFSDSHTIIKSYFDEGYILVFPNVIYSKSNLTDMIYKIYSSLSKKAY